MQIPVDFTKLAEKTVSKYNCSIVKLSFVNEKKQNILRLVIDGADTSLDVCANISRELSKWLDSHEYEIKIKNYAFEVSSPGGDKKLTSEDDYKSTLGKLVYFETKTKASDGRKRYKGRVNSVENGIITIYVEDESAEFQLSISDISKSRIEYEF